MQLQTNKGTVYRFFKEALTAFQLSSPTASHCSKSRKFNLEHVVSGIKTLFNFLPQQKLQIFAYQTPATAVWSSKAVANFVVGR